MLSLYERFRKSVQDRVDPLAESCPQIEWVKFIQDGKVAAAFIAAANPAAARIILDSKKKYIMKTTGGAFYVKNGERHAQWQGFIDGSYRQFNSPHLDRVLTQAKMAGLYPQTSADDLCSDYMDEKLAVLKFGTPGRQGRIEIDFPPVPPIFKKYGDYLTTRDLKDIYPEFTAYLARKGHDPYWQSHGYDKNQDKDNAAPHHRAPAY